MAEAVAVEAEFVPVNLGGRPRLYETEEQLALVIGEYFQYCVNKEKRPTISGLALELGMTTQTLRQYEQKDKFSSTIKQAKQIVESNWEERLFSGGCTGAIFWLKNNAKGWHDKTEQELTGKDGEALMPTISDADAARRIAFALIKGVKDDRAS